MNSCVNQVLKIRASESNQTREIWATEKKSPSINSDNIKKVMYAIMGDEEIEVEMTRKAKNRG